MDLERELSIGSLDDLRIRILRHAQALVRIFRELFQDLIQDRCTILSPGHFVVGFAQQQHHRHRPQRLAIALLEEPFGLSQLGCRSELDIHDYLSADEPMLPRRSRRKR